MRLLKAMWNSLFAYDEGELILDHVPANRLPHDVGERDEEKKAEREAARIAAAERIKQARDRAMNRHGRAFLTDRLKPRETQKSRDLLEIEAVSNPTSFVARRAAGNR